VLLQVLCQIPFQALDSSAACTRVLIQMVFLVL
jgi:hypothetical protein